MKDSTIIESIQTRIRTLTLELYLLGKPKLEISRRIKQLIRDELHKVNNIVTRGISYIALLVFAAKVYKEVQTVNPRAFQRLGELTKPGIEQQRAINYFIHSGANEDVTMPRSATPAGTPGQVYQQEYVKKVVAPLVDRICESEALDPGDVSGRNSLRNRAEMEARYQGHQDNINDLKSRGVKLVIASTHADCSERCRQWQGRVYSLDSTRGVTDDGRAYVPLEEATDVYYTTKAGATYKNGLLGFNCRHYLVEYQKGKEFDIPTPEEDKIEYQITLRMREMERTIRELRIRLNEWDALRKVQKIEQVEREYEKVALQLRVMIQKYKQFCIGNNRAIQMERTKVI